MISWLLVGWLVGWMKLDQTPCLLSLEMRPLDSFGTRLYLCDILPNLLSAAPLRMVRGSLGFDRCDDSTARRSCSLVCTSTLLRYSPSMFDPFSCRFQDCSPASPESSSRARSNSLRLKGITALMLLFSLYMKSSKSKSLLLNKARRG